MGKLTNSLLLGAALTGAPDAEAANTFQQETNEVKSEIFQSLSERKTSESNISREEANNQIDQNSYKQIFDKFMATFNVKIPNKQQEKYAEILNNMYSDFERESAQKLLKRDLKEIPDEHKAEYIMMVLSSMDNILHGRPTSQNVRDVFDTYADYMDQVDGTADEFKTEVLTYYAEEKMKGQKELAELTKELEAGDKKITENYKKMETLIQKIYDPNKNDPEFIQLTLEAKKDMEEYGYQYSSETKRIFTALANK